MYIYIYIYIYINLFSYLFIYLFMCVCIAMSKSNYVSHLISGAASINLVFLLFAVELYVTYFLLQNTVNRRFELTALNDLWCCVRRKKTRSLASQIQ
jgi:hypothetical protein